MPTRSLPTNPSLEHLRKQAKRLHRAVREGDAEALALVRELHPRPTEALERFPLADAQLVVARSYRFASWARLAHALEVIDLHNFDPPEDPAPAEGSPADRFVRLACLSYGRWHPSLTATASSLLDHRPELSRETVYTAAAAGDVDALRGLLAADPALVSSRGGAFHWEPLLYACYSRLERPGSSTLEAARLLLEAGADPDAGWLWRGNVPPFTALTGAFGEGEDGNNQPPHPHALELARLLLEAGADPNDGQTLYNRHFTASDDHLELLLELGLGQDRQGPWYRRLGERLHSPRQLLVEELWAAARKNYPARVKLLVEHGADVNGRGSRDGRTPCEAALLFGNDQIAGYLVDHGAQPVSLSPSDALAAACAAGRADEVRALLARDPQLLDRLGEGGRIQLVHAAVESNRPEAVRLLHDLGIPLDRMNEVARTPMHDAAWNGNLDMVKLLVELGADPGVREPSYQGTPLDWAEHNQQPHVAAYLRELASPQDGDDRRRR